jgi:hypothetical protein
MMPQVRYPFTKVPVTSMQSACDCCYRKAFAAGRVDVQSDLAESAAALLAARSILLLPASCLPGTHSAFRKQNVILTVSAIAPPVSSVSLDHKGLVSWCLDLTTQLFSWCSTHSRVKQEKEHKILKRWRSLLICQGDALLSSSRFCIGSIRDPCSKILRPACIFLHRRKLKGRERPLRAG